MLRRWPSTVTAVVVVLAVAAAGVTRAPVGAQEQPDPLPPPVASIVVDADTGEVITANNDRQPLPPASTTKILTALLVYEHLALDAEITVSNTAAIAPPRRLRLPAGTRWRVSDLVYAMMLCSCNDAAWALGQAAGGSMLGFASASNALAATLGMTGTPLIRDPAGLDDERSIRGGNLLTARDLAIAARAYLAVPELAAVAVAPEHVWTGGDGKPHSVSNQNRFLSSYDGAIGLKTGATQKAGLTFVAAATRGGRTLIAVVLDSQDHYASARYLLDQGFMLAAVGQGTGDTLPERVVPEPPPPVTPSTTTSTTTTTVPAQDGTAPPSGDRNGDARPPTDDDEGDEEAGPPRGAVWIGAGGGTLVACGGAVVLVRRRRNRNRIDRRPARPRRRRRSRRL